MKIEEYVVNLPHGGVAELARVLGVSPSVLYQWCTGIRKVPLARCIDVEKATDGDVRCEDLRPDVDWRYLRFQPFEAAKSA
jgi:DNA-binding transcriptional regulator YdaS (Cro superfamily)